MAQYSARHIRSRVYWKDLVAYQRYDTVRELLLPAPWLLAALVFGSFQLWLPMAFCVVYVFVFGLRVAHNAFHNALGLSRRGDRVVKAVLSIIMLGSSHAIEFTHKIHHAKCLHTGDLEGELANYPFWQALIRSPIYPVQIHIKALKDAGSLQKRWVMAELAASACVQMLMLAVFESEVFAAYTGMMLVANIIAPMVGIWAVHRACEEHVFNARSCRNPLIYALTGGMFYHAEHHLFPAIPTRKLAILAQRIDLLGDIEFLPVVPVPAAIKRVSKQLHLE